MPWKQQLPSPQSPSAVQPPVNGHAGGSGGVLHPQLSESQMYSRPSPHKGESWTVSSPHPFESREAWATAAESLGPVDAGPDEQLATRRAAAMGAARVRSPRAAFEDGTGPSLLHMS